MDLVGAWLRQLLKAGTAAALVPAAMVAALVVVLVGAGGFGGLRALGQLVSGPQVSPAERDMARVPAGGRDVAPVAPAVASESSRRAPAARRGASGSRGAGAQPAQPLPLRPGVDPGADPTVRPPRTRIDPLPPAPPPGPAAPARPPTLKERTQVLGDKLKDTVGDVGTAVQDIVDGLEQTLGRIAPPPPQAAR